MCRRLQFPVLAEPLVQLRLGPTGLIEAVCPFDAVTQAQLRRIRPRGHWSSQQRCWQFPLEAAPALEQQLAGRFPITPELAQWLAWYRQPLPPLPPHRRMVMAAGLDEPLPDGRMLYRHQRLAVRWLLARRGAVLADAMGLGKTLTALVAARAMVRLTGCRLLVVAPAALHRHWRQEALALELQPELQSWARLPGELPPAGTILIADEAHFAQNSTCLRTRAFLRLARHPRLRAIWLLTGTPMKNGRPSQLLPLLAAIGHPLASDQRHYEETFCQGHWREKGGRRVWQACGASRLDELSRLVRPLLLHRAKHQCLDLPPKQRQLVPVHLEAEPARGFHHQVQSRIEDYRCRAARGEVRRDAEALAVFMALRQLGSTYKLPATRNLLMPLLARDEPVVIFTAFVATAELLHASLGGNARGVLLTGRQAIRRRQDLVDEFQAGRRSFLVATFGTGGLGFTLHRARHVVLVERPWTPGDAEQAEDRCHRIGMQGSLTSHWLQLGAADQLVDDLISSKAERISLLFGDRERRLQRRTISAMVREWLEQP